MKKSYKVAILGATGVVGRMMLELLVQRNFPVSELYLLASDRSKGLKIKINGREYPVLAASDFDFTGVDVALFSAGTSTALKYAPIAASAGAVVIDNSSAYRLDDEVPLIVPEVNPNEIERYQQKKIIANPNCSTIQMLVALFPIYCKAGIERINVATYQSVSGSGKKYLDELHTQSKNFLQGRPVTAQYYPQQIAFNVFPQVDEFEANGYTREEMKMYYETQKIFCDKNIKVNATTVRVPVFYGHSEAVHIETRTKITVKETIELLKNTKGITIFENNEYPTPAVHVKNDDNVHVGRIREDITHDRGLNLWVVANNIRKGAATNAIQIAEKLIEQYI